MATPRGRGLRPGGVVRALLRLLVLVAVGFGLGLLFGVVTEEPELLAGHLAGESESVSLEEMRADGARAPSSVQGEPGDSPVGKAVAAADSKLQGAERPAPADTSVRRPVASARESAESVTLPRVAAAPSVLDRPAGAPTPLARSAVATESAASPQPDRWSIQVGAFSDEGAADRLAEGLRSRYPVAVLPASDEGDRWRVRVQPIRGEARARKMAEELKRDERLPTWVTPMEGRADR